MSSIGSRLSGQLTLWYGIAGFIIVVDQLSKLWADDTLDEGPMIFTSFFRFQLAYNSGAAFSFLQDAGGWQRWLFALIAIAVSVGLIVWIAKVAMQQRSSRRWELLALSLVLAGALGNLIDRIRLGHVIDFIVVHYQQYAWPTFNIADSAICVGAGLLLYDMFFLQGKDSRQDDEASEVSGKKAAERSHV